MPLFCLMLSRRLLMQPARCRKPGNGQAVRYIGLPLRTGVFRIG